MLYVAPYLFAIIAANLTIARFGPALAIPVAFLCIGFDLTSRDHLHDAWNNRGLLWKMAALIAAGSVLSWMLNHGAGSVALASFVAFAASAIVDALTYQALHDRVRLIKVNGSNVASATVDSLLFPTLAFGSFLPLIVIGQFIAKVLGGALWYLILKRSPHLAEQTEHHGQESY